MLHPEIERERERQRRRDFVAFSWSSAEAQDGSLLVDVAKKPGSPDTNAEQNEQRLASSAHADDIDEAELNVLSFLFFLFVASTCFLLYTCSPYESLMEPQMRFFFRWAWAQDPLVFLGSPQMTMSFSDLGRARSDRRSRGSCLFFNTDLFFSQWPDALITQALVPLST